ncbi:ClC family H(+)/Cl(-) exchange transporter [Bifidobacterium sp. SMB2]|uniref:ClC family H(+)/Cl(-) exchange transporter n=1 Tax=Bifidobacterium saimiriisciurei TaxID=2661627 RepID=A0ABX0CAA3_9BIFI|nr:MULTISPECIES: ClC family H(+)/Cl(-) exchange transporter [Bifidobacterium]NEG95468.1 ClC family H(+)/Cl(-) exchange transporter [Bifidobacterium sp. SMB2]NEH11626.1 ClC family H(+)/Cl(-) exchange transporter [Bifidobacterium saimiriisciurei]
MDGQADDAGRRLCLHIVKSQIHRFLSDFNRAKWRIAAKGVIGGFAVGLLVVLYRLGIEYGTRFAQVMYGTFREHPIYILPWAAAAVIAGLLVAWLVRWEPMASGSGIPQTEGVVTCGMRMRSWSVLVVRFAGGLLCGLFGLSMGREGPSVQIGAATSQMTAGRLGRSNVERNVLTTAGAAAGLSAAFCAPLSGVMFALEEIHRSFSPTILLTAMSASLTADFVAKQCFGMTPVLDFTRVEQLPIEEYWWLIPLGLAMGVVGVAMNRLLLGMQTLMNHVPAAVRPIISLAVALPCGVFLPLTLGGGSNLIAFVEQGGAALSLLLVLLAVKMTFTATSFGSGCPGGIFMPILAVGALAGGIVATVGGYLGGFAHLDARYISVFAVMGMAGTLSAAVKSPVTSVLLIVEMSGNITHMLPVATCAFLALLVSDLCGTKPIYEALLDRYQRSHGIGVGADAEIDDVDFEDGDFDPANARPSAIRSGVIEHPVEIGSPIAGTLVRNVPLPDGMMIITVRRGSRDFVPSPDTPLHAGDYVVVLFNGHDEPKARITLNRLCRGNG